MFVGTVHSVFCEVICLWMFVPKYVWFTDPCVFAQITKISEPKHVEVCWTPCYCILAPAISSVSEGENVCQD